jgi:hypothetical protein
LSSELPAQGIQRDANHASRFVSDHKCQSAAVIAPDCTVIVVVDAFFNCIDFNRRKIMLGLYRGGHSDARFV